MVVCVSGLLCGTDGLCLRDVATHTIVSCAPSLSHTHTHTPMQYSSNICSSKLMQVKIEADNCGEVALYHGALYMWQAGRSDKARILIDKLLKQNKGSIPGLALRGWIDVTSGPYHYDSSL